MIALSLLLALSAHAGPVPGTEAAYDALLALDPEARAEVVQRLVDEGLLAPIPAPSASLAEARGMHASVEVRVARARDALRAGRPHDALPWLEPVRADPRVAPLWREAVDEHVYARRELAGRWYRHASRLHGAERRRALKRARDLLAGVAADHPDTVYIDAVLDALSRVEATLDAEARRRAASR